MQRADKLELHKFFTPFRRWRLVILLSLGDDGIGQLTNAMLMVEFPTR